LLEHHSFRSAKIVSPAAFERLLKSNEYWNGFVLKTGNIQNHPVKSMK
jgi:hypothetical protein